MHALYDLARQALFVAPPLFCPVQFFVDAPFGRFTPSTPSPLLFDGIHSWILMEIVSPLAFLYAFFFHPLSSTPVHTPPAAHALAALYLCHYANRALVSPLRTPSRSKAHASVTLAGMAFNVVNGTLMGTYLASPLASSFLSSVRPAFWPGILLWALGFAGNVLHDEVLLDIRRKARAKGKGKAIDGSAAKHKEHYGIPHGYLYTYISFPNYLCEWVEWFGFALAAAPIPDMSSFGMLVASVQPPWIFFLSEIFLMIARAYKGHRWYLKTFPDYPKDRNVVIPYFF